MLDSRLLPTLILTKITNIVLHASISPVNNTLPNNCKPVQSHWRDEGLEHHHHHLSPRQLVLHHLPSPAGHLLAAFLPPYKCSTHVKDPVEKKALRGWTIAVNSGSSVWRAVPSRLEGITYFWRARGGHNIFLEGTRRA